MAAKTGKEKIWFNFWRSKSQYKMLAMKLDGRTDVSNRLELVLFAKLCFNSEISK